MKKLLVTLLMILLGAPAFVFAGSGGEDDYAPFPDVNADLVTPPAIRPNEPNVGSRRIKVGLTEFNKIIEQQDSINNQQATQKQQIDKLVIKQQQLDNRLRAVESRLGVQAIPVTSLT